MRRVRKTKHWKFNKLVKARVLKLNYTLAKRTLRKNTNKNRNATPGFLNIGGHAITNFLYFLQPSLRFSYFNVNSITASVFPSLLLPKSTNSTPKYALSTPQITPISGYLAKKLPLMPSKSYSPGLHILLMFNSLKDVPSQNNVNLRALVYNYNYFLTPLMVKTLGSVVFSNFYKKLQVDKVLKKRRLVSLYFYN